MKETARVLNISIATAKGRLFHARATLRRSAALQAIAKSGTDRQPEPPGCSRLFQKGSFH